jgi:hypothetical protein
MARITRMRSAAGRMTVERADENVGAPRGAETTLKKPP